MSTCRSMPSPPPPPPLCEMIISFLGWVAPEKVNLAWCLCPLSCCCVTSCHSESHGAQLSLYSPIFLISPLFPSLSQYVVVPTRRSTAEAFQIVISHLLGDAGSPYLIGVVSLFPSGGVRGLPSSLLFSLASLAGVRPPAAG